MTLNLPEAYPKPCYPDYHVKQTVARWSVTSVASAMPYVAHPTATEEDAFIAHAEAQCRARGTSLTPIRRQVLTLLRRAPGGLKAYDLLDRIKAMRPSATPPTVYRALDFLIEQGLAHKIGRINQFVACNHDCHDLAGLFLVCPDCGKVTELHDETAVRALSRSLAAAGHRLAGSEIELSAVCSDCDHAAAHAARCN